MRYFLIVVCPAGWAAGLVVWGVVGCYYSLLCSLYVSGFDFGGDWLMSWCVDLVWDGLMCV